MLSTKSTRKGRYDVKDGNEIISSHNEPDKAQDSARETALLRNKTIKIQPPIYEIEPMEIFDTISTSISIQGGWDSSQAIVYDPCNALVTLDPADAVANVSQLEANGWGGANSGINLGTSICGAKGNVACITVADFRAATGYAGVIPGLETPTHVGLLEGLGRYYYEGGYCSPGYQSNHYYWFPSSGPSSVPQDLWASLWIYNNNYGAQLSDWNYAQHAKLFYPCSGGYGCTTHKWLMSFAPNSFGAAPKEEIQDGMFFLLHGNISQPAISDAKWTANPLIASGGSSQQYNLGQNLDQSVYITANNWWQAKIHIAAVDTSIGNAFEVWLRPMYGNWTKVTEFISGTTPDFSWNIGSTESTYGHQYMEIGSIWPGPNGSPPMNWWMYHKDLIFTDAESKLPDYTDY